MVALVFLNPNERFTKRTGLKDPRKPTAERIGRAGSLSHTPHTAPAPAGPGMQAPGGLVESAVVLSHPRLVPGGAPFLQAGGVPRMDTPQPTPMQSADKAKSLQGKPGHRQDVWMQGKIRPSARQGRLHADPRTVLDQNTARGSLAACNPG